MKSFNRIKAPAQRSAGRFSTPPPRTPARLAGRLAGAFNEESKTGPRFPPHPDQPRASKRASPQRRNASSGQARRTVRLEFMHPTAQRVAIAGTFNDWRPEVTPMIAMGEGRWVKERVLPPGDHQYLLVADGEWLVDHWAVLIQKR